MPRARKATETPSGAEPEAADVVPTPPDEEDEDLEEYERQREELVAKLEAVITERGMPQTLVGKLAMITGVIGKVRKTGRNTYHNYSYAKESDLVEGIRPLLARMGIWLWWSLAQEPEKGIIAHQRLSQTKRDKQGNETGSSDTLTVIAAYFKFIDGENEQETEPQLVMGYGDDNGDKGLYKAYTGMEKYFLFKSFLVSTGDDPEGDARTDRRAEAREAGSGPNVNVQQRQDRPQGQRNAPAVSRGHQGGNAGQMVQGGRQAANTSPVEQLRRAVFTLGLKKAEDILPVVERLSGKKAEVAEGQTPAQVLPAFLSTLGDDGIRDLVGKLETLVEDRQEKELEASGAEAVQGAAGAPVDAPGGARDGEGDRPDEGGAVGDDPSAGQTGWEDDPEPSR